MYMYLYMTTYCTCIVYMYSLYVVVCLRTVAQCAINTLIHTCTCTLYTLYTCTYNMFSIQMLHSINTRVVYISIYCTTILLDDIEMSLPPRPPSSNAILPSIKVRPPSGKVRRTTEPAISLSTKKISRSTENLLSDGLGAPQRVQSKPNKVPEPVTQRPNTPTRQRITGGRDSPVRTKSSSLSRKAVMGLSQENVKQFVSFL